MNSLQSSLYTAALALWLFSSGLLRERSKGRGIALSYFSVFLAAESAGLVFELLMAHPQIPLKALWLGLRMATSLIVAPALWLAVREMIEGERPALRSLGQMNIALVITGAVLTLPLIGSAHLGVTYYNPENPTTPGYSKIIHGTMLGCIAIFAWQVPSYLWRCRQALARQFSHEKAVRRFPAFGRPTWLQLPLLIVFTTWILGLLRTVHCISHAPQGFGLFFSAADVGVTVGAIYTMVRRASAIPPEYAERETPVGTPPCLPVLQTSDQVSPVVASSISASLEPIARAALMTQTAPPDPVTPSAETVLLVATGLPEKKYARSSLPAPVRERIKRKLHAALATEAIYRDSLLSLRSLSAIIKENAHYVSQVINQDLNSNFYQVLSRARIEEAKKLLIGSPGETVLEIALSVGFNSKSTFNTAFRCNTGVTPREFRERHASRDKPGPI